MSALLLRGELVLEVHARRAGLDHIPHQLEGVDGAAEPRFGVGQDGRVPIDIAFTVEGLYLVGPHQGVVQAFHQLRTTV